MVGVYEYDVIQIEIGMEDVYESGMDYDFGYD